MDTQQPPPQLPKINFRVLIIGRANAGKTSILRRVCDTTQSPTIIRRTGLTADQVHLDPSMDVSDIVLLIGYYWPFTSVASTALRTNLSSPIMTVIFFMIPADLSRETTRNWRKCRNSCNRSPERRICKIDYMQYGLDYRVFMIASTDGRVLRYCVPMDNQRPELDLKYFKDICPDQNGASLWTFLTVFNAKRWSPYHWGVHEVWPVPA